MARFIPGGLPLDYGPGLPDKMLGNVSGIAAADGLIWTVSDEGRSLECLRPNGAGYALAERFGIDRLLPGLPGFTPRGKSDELDLEAVDVADGRLWLCGSHTLVRSERKSPSDLPKRNIHPRESRNLLARIGLDDGWPSRNRAERVPTSGAGALRPVLEADPWLARFRDLPSKENGIDIEGMTVFEGNPVLGLRGPLIDGLAVAVTLTLGKGFRVRGLRTHFLDLGGLAIRDLTRFRDGIAILAGPTGPAKGPFAIYLWHPDSRTGTAAPSCLFDWDRPTGGAAGKPEGFCPDPRAPDRMIVVSDGRAALQGNVLIADLIEGL